MGADYESLGVQLTFDLQMAVTAMCETVLINNDGVLEDDEAFLVDLTTVDPNVSLSPDSTLIITILDNDGVLSLHETVDIYAYSTVLCD